MRAHVLMTPTVPDPDLSTRALDVAEWVAKVGAGGAVLVGLFRGIWQPVRKWRQTAALKKQTEFIERVHEVLQPMLELQRREMQQALAAVDSEVGMLVNISKDMNEHIEELSGLLSHIGLDADRRNGNDRRMQLEDVIDTRNERRQGQRRRGD